MIHLPELTHKAVFPDPSQALSRPNGLLAFGGDLSVARLTTAYAKGIFPWYSPGEPILWWSPTPRGILPLEQFYCSSKLAKLVRQQRFAVTLNYAFDAVIDACATTPRNDSGTWITAEMIEAYKHLHKAGHAHSIEVWQGDILVGGLYGVVSAKLFCGESMFHHLTDCSKLAMYYLVELLKAEGSSFIDCQMVNPHLQSLGCIATPRTQFLAQLKVLQSQSFSIDCWKARTLSPHI
ncbi:leucyl/phenylalanyl-tRNA--protein transferase [Flavobacterium sp. W21_SRS_FM6]|uniref:leucyl/phenylalanyl-tRNA--protein transferase n=1 Tax=Flavobacterium sp. W21_SRS_FM6 TaxID=3240268 RepID=UPI003F90CCEC